MFDINQMKESVGKWGKSETPEQNEKPSTGSIRAKTKPSTSKTAAMIGPSIRIKGDLVGEEDLIIQGTVEGTINLHNNALTIGENGCVHANLHATTINVEGELRGDLFGSEKVVIRKTGNVKGNITAPRVTLEDGAMFKGSIEMDPKSVSSFDSSVDTSLDTSTNKNAVVKPGNATSEKSKESNEAAFSLTKNVAK